MNNNKEQLTYSSNYDLLKSNEFNPLLCENTEFKPQIYKQSYTQINESAKEIKLIEMINE